MVGVTLLLHHHYGSYTLYHTTGSASYSTIVIIEGVSGKRGCHVFDKMEFCMLLLRSTYLLFVRNVLSTHTQSFLVIRNIYLNASFSKSRNFYPQRVYAGDDHFQIFENGLKILLLTTLKYCVCNGLCLKQCLKSFIAPKQIQATMYVHT